MLSGSLSVAPEFTIKNETSAPVVLESARLLSKMGDYSADLPGGGAVRWRTAMPGSSQKFPLYWQFKEDVANDLGDEFSILMSFRVGDKLQAVYVKFVRVF